LSYFPPAISNIVDCICSLVVIQGDHLSGKPGNVTEVDSSQGNVGDFTKSQGKKSCQEKVA